MVWFVVSSNDMLPLLGIGKGWCKIQSAWALENQWSPCRLILLMQEILHQLRLVVYPIIYKVFIYARWCRISSINRMLVPRRVSIIEKTKRINSRTTSVYHFQNKWSNFDVLVYHTSSLMKALCQTSIWNFHDLLGTWSNRYFCCQHLLLHMHHPITMSQTKTTAVSQHVTFSFTPQFQHLSNPEV